MPRKALLLGSIVVGAALLAPPAVTGGLGLASAEAASKKAGGRAAKSTAAKSGKAASKGTRRVRFVQRNTLAGARYAALPKFKPKVVLRQAAAPAAAGSVAPTSAEAAVPAPAITEPKTASTAALPPERVLATASIAPAPVVHPGAERMRPALEARAQMMAAALGTIAMPLPDAAPPVQLTARSVTFDMEKGERTIVFEDGATVTAPFDMDRASDLTGVRPARR